MKTKEELYKSILDETVAYYSEDVNRRARNAGGCDYITSDGRMCAVGRCLVDPQAVAKSDISGEWAGKVLDSSLGELKPEYKEATSKNFWVTLQNLHDENENWTQEGLSSEGIFVVQQLKKRIEDGEFNS